MCRISSNVRFHHQSLSDVLADHVAGDLAEDVSAQVQEPSAPAQSQGRVQGRAIRARRRLLLGAVISYLQLSPWSDTATSIAAEHRKSFAVIGEKEPQQEAAAVDQIKVHGSVGHICPGGWPCDQQLSPRVQVHGKAGWSKTGTETDSIRNVFPKFIGRDQTGTWKRRRIPRSVYGEQRRQTNSKTDSRTKRFRTNSRCFSKRFPQIVRQRSPHNEDERINSEERRNRYSCSAESSIVKISAFGVTSFNSQQNPKR